MAYTDIDKPTDYFNTVLYTGDGSASRDITGVGFQPDFTWIKQRSDVFSHVLGNSVSGDNKFLTTNGTGAESTDSAKFRTFVSDGFQVGSHASVNRTSDTYVGWSWLGGGTASSNTDGSITSNVSANTTSGFSIVSYTGNGTADATIGHGLNDTIAMIILKNRDDAENWWVYHKGLSDPSTKAILLNSTNAEFTPGTSAWNPSGFSTSVFSVKNDNASNSSGDDYIAYCFAEKKGFSKFGRYTGNGNVDGTFVYTGFKPAFVIIKVYSTTNSWDMYDSARNPFNDVDLRMYADLSNADNSDPSIDFVSNGFKLRDTLNANNGSGNSFIYMAFASEPFTTSTGIPCTAR